MARRCTRALARGDGTRPQPPVEAGPDAVRRSHRPPPDAPRRSRRPPPEAPLRSLRPQPVAPQRSLTAGGKGAEDSPPAPGLPGRHQAESTSDGDSDFRSSIAPVMLSKEVRATGRPGQRIGRAVHNSTYSEAGCAQLGGEEGEAGLVGSWGVVTEAEHFVAAAVRGAAAGGGSRHVVAAVAAAAIRTVKSQGEG